MSPTGRVSSVSRGAAVKHACGSHGGDGLTPVPASSLARRGPGRLRITQSWLNLTSSMEHATEQPLMPATDRALYHLATLARGGLPRSTGGPAPRLLHLLLPPQAGDERA